MMNELERTKAALKQAEAERIALADSFRRVLEEVGFDPTTAALYVQEVIDQAKAK